MFRPTAGAWLNHDVLGFGFVAADAGVSPVGFKDKGFTMVSHPNGRRTWVLASACTDAPPPRGTAPRLAYDVDAQAPADV